jgi:hypothetical protein
VKNADWGVVEWSDSYSKSLCRSNVKDVRGVAVAGQVDELSAGFACKHGVVEAGVPSSH